MYENQIQAQANHFKLFFGLFSLFLQFSLVLTLDESELDKSFSDEVGDIKPSSLLFQVGLELANIRYLLFFVNSGINGLWVVSVCKFSHQ